MGVHYFVMYLRYLDMCVGYFDMGVQYFVMYVWYLDMCVGYFDKYVRYFDILHSHIEISNTNIQTSHIHNQILYINIHIIENCNVLHAIVEIFTQSVARRSEIENSPEPRGISRNTI